MKKGLLLLTVGCIMMLMSGCSFGAKEEKDINIGVVMYDEYDTFVSQLVEAFTKDVTAETNENGTKINVLKMNSAGSQITQNDQVNELIKKGCDVICVNLVDRTDPAMIIEAARDADVPLIFFNRELVNQDLYSWEKLYYIGADAYDSGKIEGKIAADHYLEDPKMDKNGDGQLQLVVIEGEPGHQDAIIRTEYSVSTIMDAGIKVDKLESSIANWKRTEAKSKMSQMIDKYGKDIELVLANNDDMALGAIDEYDARNIPLNNRPEIVGIDGTDIGLIAVEEGEMLGTVYNDKGSQSRAMLRLALTLARDEEVDEELTEELGIKDGKYIRYPYAMVTKDNVGEYLNK